MILCLLCGCAAEPVPEEKENILQPESSSSENYEFDKILLKLPHHLDEKFDSAVGIEQHSRRVDIPFAPPEEIREHDSLLMEIDVPQEILEEIKADYPDFGGEGWKTTLKYFSDDLSAGMIKIIYAIEDTITTNKAAIATIENGKIVRIAYTNMEMETDEAELLERVEKFKESTIQEKKTFEEDELFLSEDIQYVYYYNLDTLVYCYQLFFYKGAGEGAVINNEYASEYIIDDNGGVSGWESFL